MAEAALKDYESVPIPRRIKISSKRQITIPVDIYDRCGFAEYALLTETPEGLNIQPFDLADDDEQLTLTLLKYLMDNGFEGDELLEKYAEIKPKFVSYYSAVKRSEADIKAGRVGDFAELQQKMREKYDL